MPDQTQKLQSLEAAAQEIEAASHNNEQAAKLAEHARDVAEKQKADAEATWRRKFEEQQQLYIEGQEQLRYVHSRQSD